MDTAVHNPRVASVLHRYEHLYIGGEWVVPFEGGYAESIDPAIGRPWAVVPMAAHARTFCASRLPSSGLGLFRRSSSPSAPALSPTAASTWMRSLPIAGDLNRPLRHIVFSIARRRARVCSSSSR